MLILYSKECKEDAQEIKMVVQSTQNEIAGTDKEIRSQE